LRQAPEPSQVPSFLHDADPASVHWLVGVPAGTNLHVPRLPASAHDWQVPVQAVAQQVDWLQFPCTHSAPVMQDAPSDFLPQTLIVEGAGRGLQVFGLTQSVLDVHEARHAVAPHTNGVHVDCVPG
jgi:hypothetical protein